MNYLECLPSDLLSQIALYLRDDDLWKYIQMFSQIDNQIFWNEYINVYFNKSIAKYFKPPSNFSYYNGIIKSIGDTIPKLIIRNNMYECNSNSIKNIKLFKSVYNKLIQLLQSFYANLCLHDFNHTIFFSINNKVITFYANLLPRSNNYVNYVNPKNINIPTKYGTYTYSYIDEIIVNQNVNELLEEIAYNNSIK